eukprot:10817252-Alexandrium_andersonii.AAC.1
MSGLQRVQLANCNTLVAHSRAQRNSWMVGRPPEANAGFVVAPCGFGLRSGRRHAAPISHE